LVLLAPADAVEIREIVTVLRGPPLCWYFLLVNTCCRCALRALVEH
jgi:hypothetical protein